MDSRFLLNQDYYGALMRNENLKFMCRTVQLRVENNETMFTSQYEKDEIINIPIAHGEGITIVMKRLLNN